MKNNILLSICIPTYNQPEKLERFLKSIDGQITPDLEILIQDDSINDESRKVTEKFSSKMPIRYFERHCYFKLNGKNIEKLKKGEKGGIDRSIIFLTQEAKGDYIWWMGDDALNSGAIEKVISILKDYPNITFMWVNHRIADSGNSALDLGESHFFRDRNEVIEQVIGGLGFISATIFKKEKALSGIEESKKYIGTAFVNLYLALYVLSKEGYYFYLRGPYFTSYLNTPDEVNDNGFEVFGVYFYHIFFAFQNNFNKRSIKKALTENFGSVWRGMLIRWVTGYESPKGKRWQMFKLYWNFLEFWVAIWLFLMPLWVNKILYRIYKIFFSHRKWIFKEKIKLFFKK